ncbi:hypothetical protein [Actinoplanes sp. HUAS TT8]|uniref:hypothetical protein n=1 Tax=Actinoplanes sp. HUAS TT8 TaxID=3447453 RepID=UPI003F52153C
MTARGRTVGTGTTATHRTVRSCPATALLRTTRAGTRAARREALLGTAPFTRALLRGGSTATTP